MSEERVMKMNVYIPDDLEMNFRTAVYERLGYKKGNLNRAVKEAIDLWLNQSGKDRSKDVRPQVLSKIEEHPEEETAPKVASDKTDYENIPVGESELEVDSERKSFDELYKEYKALKDFTDEISVKKCAVIIRELNKMIDARNAKTPEDVLRHRPDDKSIKSV